MDMVLAGCYGTLSIADDIIVYGTDDKDHDSNLHNLMVHAREKGLVFNPDKCMIKAKEVRFYGMTYTAEGVRPDERKVREIADLPSPKNAKEIQQFLGMVQYLAPFIPNLSDETSVLRDLIKKDVNFIWTTNHEIAFNGIKKQICKTVTLKLTPARKDWVLC